MSTGRQSKRATLIVASVVATWLSSLATSANGAAITFRLSGAQEVPVVLTEASGWGQVRVGEHWDLPRIRVELMFRDLTEYVTQVHLHLGQPGVNGGVAAWICVDRDGPAARDAPFGTASCYGSYERLVVDIFEEDVIEIESQGLDAGDLRALMNAVRHGNTYINVHSERFPTGELRGQVQPGGGNALGGLAGRVDALEQHSHQYLTGKGNGHNNRRATTSRPDL